MSAITGSVTWWNDGKGYGFIKPDNGAGDVFLHFSEVSPAGSKLSQGTRLQFEVREGRRGPQAAKVHVLSEGGTVVSQPSQSPAQQHEDGTVDVLDKTAFRDMVASYARQAADRLADELTEYALARGWAE
jgi:cold shock CspA family protein